jgi:hypothetical protein
MWGVFFTARVFVFDPFLCVFQSLEVVSPEKRNLEDSGGE